jgi:hypothetical protein
MNITRIAAAATLVNGALAGSDIDRAVVQMPAFVRLGAARWAEFSAHADLSRRGLALYPAEGIGGTLLSIATAAAMARSRGVRKSARIASVAAALLALGGLAVTVKAAPNILSLRNPDADPQRAFDGFRYWSYIRDGFQISAFAANVATLALLD